MKYKRTNQEIRDILSEMALFYSMDGVAWKPAAYERVADSVSAIDQPLGELFAAEGVKGLMREVHGAGSAIANHIAALITKGTFSEYEKFKLKYPVHLLELTSLENIGPRTVATLYKKLGIRDLEDLERAARAHKLHAIRGFGEKTEQNILLAIERLRRVSGRRLLGEVLPIASRLETALLKIPGVKHAVTAGSVRRRQETIGDIDILVTTSKPKQVMDAFSEFPEVLSVFERGKTKLSVRLQNGMNADIRIIPKASFGAALQYFTGDKQHNIFVRELAIKKGLKLNEYGLWKGKKQLAARTEEEVYRALGLDYIEPELRTVSGELEAAKVGKLPKLISYNALRGDLQVQTNWTDGEASIEDMANEARRLGLSYIAITDHTHTLAMTGGLNAAKLAKQGRTIDAINLKLKKSRNQENKKSIPFTILKGTECDILKNGKLDLPDSALAKLDLVGVSIHSHFKLSRAEQTKRLITAIKNPHVDIVFHPTTRRIGRRDEIEIDIEAVLKAAKDNGVAIEINSSPDRMDIRDAYVRKAVTLGVKLVINSDSHAVSDLSHNHLGVAIARRGWAQASDILNTRDLKSLLAWLQTPKSKRS